MGIIYEYGQKTYVVTYQRDGVQLKKKTVSKENAEEILKEFIEKLGDNRARRTYTNYPKFLHRIKKSQEEIKSKRIKELEINNCTICPGESGERCLGEDSFEKCDHYINCMNAVLNKTNWHGWKIKEKRNG